MIGKLSGFFDFHSGARINACRSGYEVSNISMQEYIWGLFETLILTLITTDLEQVSGVITEIDREFHIRLYFPS